MSNSVNFLNDKQKHINWAKENSSKVLSFFQIDEITSRPILIKNGIANINCLVKTKNASYVLKILLSQRSKNLTNEISIQKQLNNAGILCPIYIKNSQGIYFFEENEVRVVVSELISGIRIKSVTNEFCFNIGKTLAQFHSSVSTLNNINKGWLNKDHAPFDSKHLRSKNKELYWSLCGLKEKGQSIIYKENFPKGIIHGDLYEGNVLVNTTNINEISAIFDFEHAEYNVLLIDLARTILGVAEDSSGKKFDTNLIESTIKGYDSVRRLEKIELNFLRDAIGYVAGVGGLWLLLHGETELANRYLLKANFLYDKQNLFF